MNLRLPHFVFALWSIVALVSGAPALAGSATSATQPTDEVGSFPIEHWDEPMVVPILRDGITNYFLIDTASSRSVVDVGAFRNLKPVDATVKIEAPKPTDPQLFAAPDIKVGPFLLGNDDPVLAGNFSTVRSATGLPIIGMLGLYDLSAFKLQIDYDHHKFRFLQPGEKADDPNSVTASGARVFPVTVIEQSPLVTLTIDGQPIQALIDTSNDATVALPAAQFQRLVSRASKPPALHTKAFPSDTTPDRQMRLEQLEVGGFKLRNIVVEETPDSRALIGISFLERFVATIDLFHGTLQLLPGHEIDRPDRHDMSGLHLAKMPDGFLVQAVDLASPAADAGFEAGDVLESIDGQRADDLSIADMHERFSSGEGKQFKIDYRRGTTKLAATITLRALI